MHNWVQTDPDIRMGDGFAAASADALPQVIRDGISPPPNLPGLNLMRQVPLL